MKTKKKRQSPVVSVRLRQPLPPFKSEAELVRWVGEMMLATTPGGKR